MAEGETGKGEQSDGEQRSSDSRGETGKWGVGVTGELSSQASTTPLGRDHFSARKR